jgi:hypothetical protein
MSIPGFMRAVALLLALASISCAQGTDEDEDVHAAGEAHHARVGCIHVSTRRSFQRCRRGRS